MKDIDVRMLGPEGHETLRKIVLRFRTQSGLNGVELATIARIHVRTVQAWLRNAHRSGSIGRKDTINAERLIEFLSVFVPGPRAAAYAANQEYSRAGLVTQTP